MTDARDHGSMKCRLPRKRRLKKWEGVLARCPECGKLYAVKRVQGAEKIFFTWRQVQIVEGDDGTARATDWGFLDVIRAQSRKEHEQFGG